MTMTVGLRSQSSIVPATASFNFNSATQFDQPGPYWISLLAWVSTPAALAGALAFSMTHDDAAGNTVLSPTIGGTLVLADGTAIFSTAPEMVVRLSGSSLWTLDTLLIGLASTARISYRVMVFPLDPSEFSPF